MSKRKLQIHEEYRLGPKSVLQPGDRFRVGGGPVYITEDGVEHSIAERGTFKFRRYCERGAQKWIEAYSADGNAQVLLWVGKVSRSPIDPSLKRKPYKIRRFTGKKRPKIRKPR